MKPLFLLLFLAAFAHAKTLKIKAGAHHRIQTVVTVPAPDEVPDHPGLKSADGKILPLQLSDDGKASFILPELAAGNAAVFELVSMEQPAEDIALAEEKGGDIALSIGRRPVADFLGKNTQLPRKDIPPIFQRGGYLHPLRTPEGNMVTDDYPLNHIHHHGVWTAWTSAVFQGRKPDFWNMGEGKGKVDCKEIGSSWSGAVHAGLEAENGYTDLTSGAPILVLNENWMTKVFAVQDRENPYNLVELVFIQKTADDDPLKLPEYRYGGLGIRGAAAWDGMGNADFLTSEGITDRNQANGKSARWIAMSGVAGEGRAGIAILGHPGNFRAPQPIRVHPHEPFISFAPQMAGDMEISHVTAYRSEYRFVLFDGAPDKQLLDRLWSDYAEPPTAAWD